MLGIRSQGDPACPLVRDLLKQKIAHLEEQIYRMKELKDELKAYQECWANRPLDNPCNGVPMPLSVYATSAIISTFSQPGGR
ncbi:MerR family DNA-binding protein [Nostoc sp. KVJ20]|uniref:MerR family DNA-binding protein n=1 Tax=Nostoc sp. KVJ20 TaxID=457944 RepID=UPI000A7867D2